MGYLQSRRQHRRYQRDLQCLAMSRRQRAEPLWLRKEAFGDEAKVASLGVDPCSLPTMVSTVDP